MKLSSWKCFIIVLRIIIGGVLLYSGLFKINQTFTQNASPSVIVHSGQSSQYIQLIDDLKRTNYFWPFLGAVEVTCGLLIASQYLSLLGAVLLMPVSVNFLMFQFFVGHDSPSQLIMTLFFFIGNILLLTYNYKTQDAMPT